MRVAERPGAGSGPDRLAARTIDCHAGAEGEEEGEPVVVEAEAEGRVGRAGQGWLVWAGWEARAVPDRSTARPLYFQASTSTPHASRLLAPPAAAVAVAVAAAHLSALRRHPARHRTRSTLPSAGTNTTVAIPDGPSARPPVLSSRHVLCRRLPCSPTHPLLPLFPSTSHGTQRQSVLDPSALGLAPSPSIGRAQSHRRTHPLTSHEHGHPVTLYAHSNHSLVFCCCLGG
jgi:hypothetical protein